MNLTCAQGIIPAGVCFILIDIQFLRLEMRIEIKIRIHIHSKDIEFFMLIVNRLLPKQQSINALSLSCFTLAKSILRVQQPAYISAPFRFSRARVAASRLSNSTMACTPFFLKITMRSTWPCGLQILCKTSCKYKEKNKCFKLFLRILNFCSIVFAI